MPYLFLTADHPVREHCMFTAESAFVIPAITIACNIGQVTISAFPARLVKHFVYNIHNDMVYNRYNDAKRKYAQYHGTQYIPESPNHNSLIFNLFYICNLIKRRNIKN